jgi:hypothetical protein
MLLSMLYPYLYSEFVMDMLCQSLGREHTAMLSSCASETEHQTRESALNVTTHMMVGQLIDTLQEGQYLSIILQKSDDRFI